MTQHLDNTLLQAVCELLAEFSFDRLAEVLTLLLNEAMKTERSRHLKAVPYNRTSERRGYANRYKPQPV